MPALPIFFRSFAALAGVAVLAGCAMLGERAEPTGPTARVLSRTLAEMVMRPSIQMTTIMQPTANGIIPMVVPVTGPPVSTPVFEYRLRWADGTETTLRTEQAGFEPGQCVGLTLAREAGAVRIAGALPCP